MWIFPSKDFENHSFASGDLQSAQITEIELLRRYVSVSEVFLIRPSAQDPHVKATFKHPPSAVRVNPEFGGAESLPAPLGLLICLLFAVLAAAVSSTAR